MTIKSVSEIGPRPIEIDLTAPEGNAYNLLGHAKRLSKMTGDDWVVVQAEMTAKDYDHLIEVFDSYFGDFVTLYK